VQHREFSFLGRAKPLRLEDIYVGLKVADHTPPAQVPDEPRTPLPQAGRTLEVPEALALSRRLLVLGEAGSGKTTLLKYLVLATARRDPRLGPFARGLLPNPLTGLLERIRHALAGANLVAPSGILGLIALLLWGLSSFYSAAPVKSLLAGAVWAVAGLSVWLKPYRHAVPIGTILASGALAYALWVPPIPVWLAALSLAGLLFPYWVRAPLALLAALVRRRTRYPLPIHLTLNNLARDGRPLQDQAAAALAECGLPHGQRLLARRLARGDCLLLLDALDEVADPQAQQRVLGEINRLRHAYGEGNQVLVTARVAGYQYGLNGYLTLEVQPFQAPQVAAFVRHWFSDTADPAERARRVDGLLAALARAPRLQSLAASPLLLALIALLYEGNLRLPQRRADLYDQALDLLTADWNRLKGQGRPPRYPSGTTRCALAELAYETHCAALRVFERDRIGTMLGRALAQCGVAADPGEFLAAVMADTGLLRRKSRSSYDFVHLTFQEFLTAQAIHGRGEEAALLGRVEDPWWREVIRLYAGLTGNAATLLETLLAADPLLAAGCLADARTPCSETTARRILAELRRLLDEDPTQRQAAADTLAEVANWGARDLLLETLARDTQDPAPALAALLALAPGAEATLAQAQPGGLGRLLRLLHNELPRVEPGLRPRVLALLEALGHPLCLVPAGEFWMGSDELLDRERPRHRVRLDDYWIDRYPVTNQQFARFAQETSFRRNDWRTAVQSGKERHPVVDVSWDPVTNQQFALLAAFQSGKERHPVVDVSWEDARAYAQWCGKRLPTEAQWEKAARGTDGRRYPWGERWDGTRFNLPGERGTTPVGAYPEGESPYGCQDMVGNVWEWVADWYDESYYGRSPSEAPSGPETGESRVMRGGSEGLNRDSACAAYRFGTPPHERSGDRGFRLVCASPIL